MTDTDMIARSIPRAAQDATDTVRAMRFVELVRRELKCAGQSDLKTKLRDAVDEYDNLSEPKAALRNLAHKRDHAQGMAKFCRDESIKNLNSADSYGREQGFYSAAIRELEAAIAGEVA